MNLRPKTKRRLLILLTAGIAIAGMATIAVVILLQRHERHRLAYRTAAMEAYQHGDYRTAAENFGKYLGNDRMDGPAIFDYAVCRSKLPRPDLSHLTEAKGLFNRYLELNPGDVDAEHQLLDIYQRLRYSSEAMALSDELLKENPHDVPALAARLGQMVRDRHYDLALPVAMELNELTPEDVQTQGTTYELMWHLHKSPADFIDRADRMLQAHPDDPRFELLRAVAAYWIGDKEDTTKWLRTAAARPAPDAEFTLMLAGAFDRMELWTDSRTLLEQNATAPTASASLKANFVQRLWEIGRYDRALVVLNGLNPADPAADSNLIGLQALVLYDQSQSNAAPVPANFKTALHALQQRPDDPVAGAWAALMSAITDTAPATPLEPVHFCQSARRGDPQNPDACFFLGREYLRIGESELGLQSLRQTTQMQPEWAGPYLLMARTLMQRGQTAAAAQAARAALGRDPQSVGAQIAFALASYHQLARSASAGDILPVLNFIQQLCRTVPDDPHLLAAQVDLLARSNRKTDAVNLAGASQLSPAALHQLALIDRSDHLGIGDLLTKRLAQCQPTTPEEALDLVQADILTGNADSAKAMLPALEAHPTPGWRLAWLQAREALGDPAVGAAWQQFAGSAPRDLNVQNAAVHSPIVNADRSLMDRTIDRLKTLTGDDAIEWKIARANWQLGGSDEVKTHANAAAASMAEVVRVAPEYAPPQEIWAEALVKIGDFNGAIGHLRLAAQIEPDNAALSLKLARLYAQQGQFRELASLLNSTQNGDWLTDPQRIEIALLYRQMGDRADAVKLLDENHTIHPDDPARDVLLAQLHAELGEDADARQIYDQWMQRKDPPAEMVRSVAWFFASRHSIPQARKSLGTLGTISLPPGEKDLLMGEFEAEWGDKSVAALEFQSATQAAPANLRGWLAWAGMNLRNRDFTGAFNVANEGLKHLPADPTLSAMRDRAQTLAGLQLDADAQDLLDALSVDPAGEAGAATLTALPGSETANDADARLRAVAEQYPRFLPAATIAIIRDFKAGQYDQAVELATRASEALPIEPEPARLLTIIYSAAGQWEHALAAAEDWRSRSLDDPHPADVAIASAQIALHQPQRAADQVSWCLEETAPPDGIASENQSPSANALELYARALCMEGRTDEALRALQPRLNQSTLWRHRWLRIVADTSPDLRGGSRRISQIQPLMPANSVEDQLALSEAWYALATRFDYAEGLEKAKSVVEPLTDVASAPAEAWLLLGSIQQQQNNLPAAEISFATAVNVAPNLPVAKNNLAMVKLLRNQDAKTAQQLALAAVAQAPANSAIHSTLGEIDEQMNDLEGAKIQFQMAVRLNAENAEALIGLASVQSRTGEVNRVALTLQQVESVLQTTHPMLPMPVREELARLRDFVKKAPTPAVKTN